jgi:hypothetical protein
VSKEIWANNDSTDALLAGQEPLWANLQKIVQHHSFMFEPLFKEILESNFSILKYPSTSKKLVARIVTISGCFGAIHTKNTGINWLTNQKAVHLKTWIDFYALVVGVKLHKMSTLTLPICPAATNMKYLYFFSF